MKSSRIIVAYTKTSVARFNPKNKAICVETFSDKIIPITAKTKKTIINFCHALTLAVLRAFNNHSPKKDIAIIKNSLRIINLPQE
jgi:hypothetical protein